VAVIAVQFDAVMIPVFCYLKGSMVAYSGEDSSSQECIQPTGGVSSGNENTFFCDTPLVPLDRDSVGRVFGGNSEKRRDESRSTLFQPDQTNSRNRHPLDEFRSKGLGKNLGDNLGAYPKIHQDSALDDPLDGRYFHGGFLLVNLDFYESGSLSNRKMSLTITFQGFFGSTTNAVGEEQILYSSANRTSSKQDEQQTGRAANRWTSLPDPFPLMAMMLGQFGLDPLRGPLLTAAFRQIHGIRLSIRESRPFQKMRRW
jgi:hypothetical protein